jgi:uncharacterized phiE125 gp8 family phage protein
MFGLSVTTEPTAEPIELAEAKQHLRVSHDAEDGRIRALIKAARKYVEVHTGLALMTQTLKLTRDYFPTWEEDYTFRLPRPPLQIVPTTLTDPTVKYYNSLGVLTTVDAATYVVDAQSHPARISLAFGEAWPTDALERIAGVEVNYVAGYASAALVPETIKQAMLLLIGNWFSIREAAIVGTIIQKADFAVDALLASAWTGQMTGDFG